MKKLISIILLLIILFIPLVTNAESSSSLDRIHFIKNEDHAGDATVIESNGHFGLIDTLKPASGLHSNEYDNGEKVAKYLELIGCTHLDFLIITHTHSDHLGGLTEADNQQHKLSDFIDSNTLIFYKPDYIPTIDGEAWDFEEHLNFGHQQFYQNALALYKRKNAKTCNLTTKDLNDSSSTDPNGGCYLRSLKNSTIKSVGQEINPFMGYNTNLDDNYYFDFGNYSLKIYNIHIVANQMENLNSTPVLITHKVTGKKIAVLGDIQDHTSEYEGYQDGQYIKSYINKHLTNVLGYADNKLWADSDGKLRSVVKTDPLYQKVLKYSIREPFGSCEECTTLGEENQIADIIGPVDVVKAAHHGYNTSSSFYSIFKYKPSYMIYSKNKDKMYTYLEKDSKTTSDWKHASAIALLSYKNLGTKHYSTYQVGNNKGLVLTFDDVTNDLKFKALNSSGNIIDKTYNNIAANIITEGSYKDTERWYWNHNTNSTDAARIYIDANGELTTGWLEYNDNWYYFSRAEETEGLMLKGLRNLSYNSVKDTYYLTPKETSSYPEGAMQHDGFTEVEGDLYYFRKEKDDVSTGPKGAAITGWYTKNSKTYYFRKEANEYGTGRKGSALKDTCVVMDNYKYCFDESGVQTSKTKVITVTIPTTGMCKDLTYTGNIQTITDDALTGYVWINNIGVTAGVYKVTASLNEGYAWSDSTLANKEITCVIKKANRQAPTVISYSGKYDGNSHSITVTGEGTIEYSLDNTTWSTTKPTRKDVGTTTVYVRTKAETNYKASSVVEGTITIIGGKGYIIKNYTVDEANNYISNIKINTTLESFKNNINLETGYSVEVDYKTINSKKVLYTGGKTKILVNGTLNRTFTNIVKGDTNGTGQINSGDLLRIRQHLLGTKILQGEYFIASDVNSDQVINSGDLLRIRQHLLGTRYID